MANTRRHEQRASPELATQHRDAARREEAAQREEGALYEPAELTRETVAAVLGSASRNGEWEPADVTQVFSLLGNASLDFTRALLPGGVTEVQAFTVLGEVKILVPEGLEVEVTGSALLGDFKQSTQVSRTRRLIRRTLRAARGDYEDDEDEEPPLLRVTGFAIMARVKVITR